MDIPTLKDELLQKLGKRQVLCAKMEFVHFNDSHEEVYTKNDLLLDYSEQEYEAFLNNLDFVYNSYTDEFIISCIWLEDSWWIDWYENETTYYWKLHAIPIIPLELKKNLINKVLD